MPRAAFQVLVIPYRFNGDGEPRYLVFKRADQNYWQWIAGGGMIGEPVEQAARRESFEEAGIAGNTRLVHLDSTASIPAVHFADNHLWGTGTYVIPEYSFGIEVENEQVNLSGEHEECVWLDYETALNRLKWDSNKTALWELHNRLLSKDNQKS